MDGRMDGAHAHAHVVLQALPDMRQGDVVQMKVSDKMLKKVRDCSRLDNEFALPSLGKTSPDLLPPCSLRPAARGRGPLGPPPQLACRSSAKA